MLLDILCRNKKTFAILLLSMALLSLVYYFTPFFNVMFLNKNKEQFFSLIETIISFSSIKSSPDSCVKCYTMFLPFLLIKIDVFS